MQYIGRTFNFLLMIFFVKILQSSFLKLLFWFMALMAYVSLHKINVVTG